MSVSAATMKKRIATMLALNGVAVVTALAAAVGYFKYAQDWALWAFVAALLCGFGAQIWLIASLRGARKGA